MQTIKNIIVESGEECKVDVDMLHDGLKKLPAEMYLDLFHKMYTNIYGYPPFMNYAGCCGTIENEPTESMQDCKINILGTQYTIEFKDDEEVCAVMGVEVGDCGGYCNEYSKLIVIANLNKCDDGEEARKALQRESMRHEITHAFLNESGLGYNANSVDCWAKDEEMVDWFAKQSPKIYKVFEKLGIL